MPMTIHHPQTECIPFFFFTVKQGETHRRVIRNGTDAMCDGYAMGYSLRCCGASGVEGVRCRCRDEIDHNVLI